MVGFLGLHLEFFRPVMVALWFVFFFRFFPVSVRGVRRRRAVGDGALFRTVALFVISFFFFSLPFYYYGYCGYHYYTTQYCVIIVFFFRAAEIAGGLSCYYGGFFYFVWLGY